MSDRELTGAERRYWTSVDEREGRTAPSRAEFPEGAEVSDEVSRRTLLGMLGATAAVAGAAGCRRPLQKIVPFVRAPEEYLPGKPRYFATTATVGTAAYGVLVESHEGRPTKIEGNELHPESRGAANAWLQASILDLYDPDRARVVRRRPPGVPDAVDLDWDQFASAWREIAAEAEATGGAGLAFLTESWASPTLARLSAAVRAKYPRARWAVWEPAGDDAALEATRRATGQALRQVTDLGACKVIVTLDADPLHTDGGALAAARGFAEGRKPGESMNRLYAVESTLTLTGSAADHRLRLKSSQIPAFAAALARELAARGLAVPLPDGAAPELPADAVAAVSVIADDLAANPGAGVVLAGSGQAQDVHVLALAVNRALGAPQTLHPATDVAWGGPASAGTGDGLSGLVAAIGAGEVTTLVIVGGNPAHDAPAELGLAEAMGQLAHSAHLATHYNETTDLCEWHLPRAHFLEAWGDARSADGTASVVQPLIQPLHQGKSAVELLAWIASGERPSAETRSGYDEVRTTWAALTGDGVFEAGWRQALHDGVAGDSALPAVDAAIAHDAVAEALDAAGRAGGDGMEVTFRPSAQVYDGRWANNAWLQELPDPVTRVTWDNEVRLSPATAESLGVETDDIVLVSAGGAQIEGPVFVLPGQADDSVGLTLGYGRSSVGRIGAGIGFDAYRLRSGAAPAAGFVVGASVVPVGRSHELVQTQEYWSMEGRDLVREGTVEEYAADPHFAQGHVEGDDDAALFDPPVEYTEGPQWGMAIDLGSCIGCNACVVACQSENNIPVVGREQVRRGREMQWLRIDRYYTGDLHDPGVVFQPVTCQHCENAPCEQVCPVGATVHDDEGLNGMTYNRCIGTRYCSNNCPYKVRRFNFFNFTKDTPELLKLAMNPDVTVRSRGVMEKCTFCLQRINAAKKTARVGNRELVDGDVVTACQQTCPTKAIHFGDIRDPESVVVHAKEDGRNYTLLGELGNRPRNSYLARIRNPNPAWATPGGQGGAA